MEAGCAFCILKGRAGGQEQADEEEEMGKVFGFTYGDH